MTEDGTEQLMRHYGKGEPFVDGEGNEHNLELLDIDYAVDYMAVMNAFMKVAVDKDGKSKDMTVQEIFQTFDQPTVEATTRLIKATLELTYPEEKDIPKRKELKKLKHYFDLFFWVLMNNSDFASMAKKNDPDGRKASSLERAQQQVKDAKDKS
jgi:hypothetical protein